MRMRRRPWSCRRDRSTRHRPAPCPPKCFCHSMRARSVSTAKTLSPLPVTKAERAEAVDSDVAIHQRGRHQRVQLPGHRCSASSSKTTRSRASTGCLPRSWGRPAPRTSDGHRRRRSPIPECLARIGRVPRPGRGMHRQKKQSVYYASQGILSRSFLTSASAIAFSASGAITPYPASFGSRPSLVSSFLKFRPSARAE